VEPISFLSRHFDTREPTRLSDYEAAGGYSGAKAALALSPDEVIEKTKQSGLRGRGGAGFPAGVKWSFVPKTSDNPKVVVCNADESEPGTFKDRAIMERDPHAVLEGCLIASYAVDAHVCYVYIRGEFVREARVLEEAIEEAKRAGHLGKNIYGTGFDLEIYVHRGAGAYICGEETGLLESLGGKRGNPRLKPPFPAVDGAFHWPTVVNNVETLANLPWIFERGVDWYHTLGTENNYGPKLYCVSGHVVRPGLYEFPMGLNLKELLFEHCGGVPGGRKLKAVIPGGSSVPVLKADECDVELNFDALEAAGSMLGSAGVIVMDETVHMPDALLNLVKFYAHESCGQCTPCREGCHWAELILSRMLSGGAKKEDPDLLLDIADNILFHCVCPLGDAAAMPVRSFVEKFRDEFEALAVV
jgi:NADH-quinone oxidoreductase subunit F